LFSRPFKFDFFAYSMMQVLCDLVLEYLDDCHSIKDPKAESHSRKLRILETSERRKFKKWTTFYQGSSRIILAAPHAGVAKTNKMKSRCGHPKACCEPDDRTNELCKELWDRLQTLGVDVSFVCAELHREYVDLNRSNVDQGPELDPEAEQVWHFYHGKIEEIISNWRNKAGVFIDFHGQNHDHEMIEMGLFLTREQLLEINGGVITEDSKKRISAKIGFQKLGFPGCVTGVKSFPTILQKHLDRIHERQVKCFPCADHPYPLENEKYFHGAYCTWKFGKGNVDAFQIESPRYLRVDPSMRKQYIKALANAIIEYTQLLGIT